MLCHLVYIFAVLLLPLAAHANRVALLVGHASYAPETKLSVINSAANDVRGVRDVLVRSLGFNAAQVKVLTDPSRDDLIDAIDWLEQNSKNAESVVFYYSGHGVSDPLGENYMLPVRGRYETLSGVQQRGVSISSVVDALKSSKPRKSLLIFDACRSVVLAKSAVGKGLAGINLPVTVNQELIVHFAAQPNSTADDGTANGYSPYTHSLLKFLPRAAELGLQDLLDMVRDDVTRNSQSGQRPQRFGEIASNTVLVGNAKPEPTRTTALQAVPRPVDREQEAWAEIQSSNNIAALQAFLIEFPSGTYTSRVRTRLAGLTPINLLSRNAAVDTNLSINPSTLKPGQVFKDCTNCPDLVVVPAGNFLMGSNFAEQDLAKAGGLADSVVSKEYPQHRVNVPSFAAGRYAVTKGEFAAFVRAKNYQTQAERDYGCWSSLSGKKQERGVKYHWRNTGFVQSDDHPVVCVSWNDAQAYIQWLNQSSGGTYRLLSEAEREYASRAGSIRAFWWGNDVGTDQANYWPRDFYSDRTNGVFRRGTVAVSSFGPNPYGLHNVHGNVLEWVQDCFNFTYNNAPADGSAWESGQCQKRMTRGGSWFLGIPHLRSAFRYDVELAEPIDMIGFRLARNL